MHHYSFSGYTRISKAKARKLWGVKDIALCPCNMRPGPPFSFDIRVCATDIQRKQISEYDFERSSADFDNVVNEFEFYNCSHETGYYTAFYLFWGNV